MAGLEGRRILVVEDEALIAMLIEDSLREAGAEIVGPSPSVVEALSLISAAGAEGTVYAAVLDVRLGDDTVLAVANELATLGVPFVFVTAYGEVQLNAHASAPVVGKPIEPEELIAALVDLLRAT